MTLFRTIDKEKINSFISFPINKANFNDYIENNDNKSPQYDLFAISNHYGKLGSGHYTASCKNHFN